MVRQAFIERNLLNAKVSFALSQLNCYLPSTWIPAILVGAMDFRTFVGELKQL